MPQYDNTSEPCLRARPARRRMLLALSTWFFTVASLTAALACLDRPIGTTQPKTTNVLTDQLVNNAVDKVDLLFVIDNSLSMADKQRLLAVAVPDLVEGLIEPACIADGGVNIGRPPDGQCPAGSAPEFTPVDDIHVGVITSSLGGYGAAADCVDDGSKHAEQAVDMAHLLGKLPRGAAVSPSAAGTGFLTWNENSNKEDFLGELTGLVTQAGERGCGWEAPLEAWVRFLVDPHPYAEIVRRPCSPTDEDNRCAGPRTNELEEPEVDTALLAERRAFLRPDSLLAVVMLSDENDCSFRASGQSWLLSRTRDEDDAYTAAIRGTAACNDPTFGPNHDCCHSCGSNAPSGCPTAVNDKDEVVPLGCEQSKWHDMESDPINLRCFRQQQRFGVDMLYPVERYSNALRLKTICPLAHDLDPESPACANGGVVDNPLYSDLQFDATDPTAIPKPPRPENLVFIAGIVGVPWQDIAISPDPGEPLTYRASVASEGEGEPPGINWRWLIGERHPVDGIPRPDDPLMLESIEPRTGTNPATGEAVAGVQSGYDANAINGHEWNTAGQGDLQYACIFPLEQPQPCLTRAELGALDDEAAADVPDCDCTEVGADVYQNPLCQQPDGSYGMTQTRAKAYPSLRQLQVLHDYGENAIVASICPKTTERDAVDYGYRPAMAAIVERLISRLGDKCYPRELATQTDGSVSCIIVEAMPPGQGATGCEFVARQDVRADVAHSVRKRLRAGHFCPDEASCAEYQLCEIQQLLSERNPDELASCHDDATPRGDGWCYLDERLGLGNPELLRDCPTTARRKVRYAGAGQPRPGSVTVVSCAGATFDETE